MEKGVDSLLTLILPGFSPHNKEWAYDLAERMKLNHKVLVHEWRHWQRGGGMAFGYETNQILKEIDKQEVNIVAKSVGTSETIRILPQIKNQVKKVILCGIPLRTPSDKNLSDFKNSLNLLNSKNIAIFQNIKDPLGNFEIIDEFIKKVNTSIKVHKMPGNDHNYPYSGEFEKFLRK